MNREEAKTAIEEKAGNDIYGMMASDLIEFLYDNGFKILKVVDAKYENREKEKPEQSEFSTSKFLQEWQESFSNHNVISPRITKLVHLIDKFKADR